jgi:CheY-like chemotaxis protein
MTSNPDMNGLVVGHARFRRQARAEGYRGVPLHRGMNRALAAWDAYRKLGVAILHVDDQPALREIVRRALNAFGFAVASAEGVRAAKLALDARDDLAGALLDVRLRDGSGLELYEWITVNHPRLIGRVAFLTGSTEADGSRGLQTAGCPILPKPFEIVDLRRLAAEWEGPDRGAPPTADSRGRSSGGLPELESPTIVARRPPQRRPAPA